MFKLLAMLLFILSGCSSSTENSYPWKEIAGREGSPVYRARIPSHWICQLTPLELLEDTKNPLCTLLIQETAAQIVITIHNFPSESIDERIPPQFQIERWKKQFQNLASEETFVIKQAHGGFSGVMLEGSGIINKNEAKMLAWAMQLNSELYNQLSYANEIDMQKKIKQMKADYTIKVVGKPELVEKNKQDILLFARSFELIEGIPSRL